MEQQRDNTVTYVKAIGIILMVVGHVLSSDMVVRKAIFTFHMPLFFLMSGYCFKEKYLDNAKQFVARKIKGIYVPFVVFSLAFLALHNVFCRLYIYDPEWLYCWKDYLWEAGRIVTRMSHNEGLLGTFWFLKELFWGNLIFYATLKLVKWMKGLMCERMKGVGAEWMTVIGLFVLTEIACIFHLRIPYFTITQTSTYAAFFIAFGYLSVKKSNWNTNKWWLYGIGIASVVAEAYLIKGTVAIDAQTPLSLIYYAATAIFGTMVVYNLCQRLIKSVSDYKWPLLNFIGEHTLSIMALHFLAFKLLSFGYIMFCGLPLERFEEFPVIHEFSSTGWGLILYSVFGMVIPLIMAWLWSRIKAKMQPIVEKN